MGVAPLQEAETRARGHSEKEAAPHPAGTRAASTPIWTPRLRNKRWQCRCSPQSAVLRPAARADRPSFRRSLLQTGHAARPGEVAPSPGRACLPCCFRVFPTFWGMTRIPVSPSPSQALARRAQAPPGPQHNSQVAGAAVPGRAVSCSFSPSSDTNPTFPTRNELCPTRRLCLFITLAHAPFPGVSVGAWKAECARRFQTPEFPGPSGAKAQLRLQEGLVLTGLGGQGQDTGSSERWLRPQDPPGGVGSPASLPFGLNPTRGPWRGACSPVPFTVRQQESPAVPCPAGGAVGWAMLQNRGVGPVCLPSPAPRKTAPLRGCVCPFAPTPHPS